MIDYQWLKEFIPPLSPGALAAINSLMQRISPNSPTLTLADVERVRSIPDMHVILASDRAAGSSIIGMARMVVVPMWAGSEGIIEDVGVDERYGGRGIGTELNRRLIERAKLLGLKRIELFTWPNREAANRLYLSLGFERLDVNYYRLNLR